MTQLEKIKQTILSNRPELSEKSVNQYASNVNSTLKSMQLDFNLEDILKKHEQIYDFLKNKYSDITFRNKLNSFYVLFCGMELSSEGNWECFEDYKVYVA